MRNSYSILFSYAVRTHKDATSNVKVFISQQPFYFLDHTHKKTSSFHHIHYYKLYWHPPSENKNFAIH